MQAPTTVEGIGQMMLEVWSTTKLLVDEVHYLRAEMRKVRGEISSIRDNGCKHRSRPPTGPVLPSLFKETCGG